MNCSSVGPSHGLQFFKNCSSVGPFPGVQPLRNKLLQHGSPTGSQVLHKTWSCQQASAPAWRVLHHGVSLSYSFLQEISTTVACSPWWTVGSMSAPLWTSMGQLTLQTTLPQATWKSLLQTLEHLLALLLHWPRGLQGCFSHIFSHFFVPHSIFTVSSICYQRGAASIAEGFSFAQWWIYFGVIQN